jgi:predicted metal-dependent hydrolase
MTMLLPSLNFIGGKDMIKYLEEQYPITTKKDKPDSIYIGHIQILKVDYKDWQPYIIDAKRLITDAEIIENFPFVKLKYLLDCKRLMDGEKHVKDIKLIQEYIDSQK